MSDSSPPRRKLVIPPSVAPLYLPDDSDVRGRWTRAKLKVLKVSLRAFVANFSHKWHVTPEMVVDQAEKALAEIDDGLDD